MWRKRLKNLLWIILIVLAIGLQLWDESNKIPNSTPQAPSPSSKPEKATSSTAKKPPAPKAPVQTSRTSKNGFEVLTGARLINDRNNDGDSFKISHDGRQFELRLYFVDAPEKRLHQYNGERIDHQGRYFGNLTRDQTMEVGLQAKDLVDELLTTRPFRVETRWKAVFDSGRHYAFVFLEDSNEELSEILVREGLVRIYTEGSDLPDGRKRADFERHLKKLEATAKAQQKGGWNRSRRPPSA